MDIPTAISPETLDLMKSQSPVEKIVVYEEAVNLLIALTDELHTKNVKLEKWQEHEEVQLVKFGLHSMSIAYLLRKTPVKHLNGEDTLRILDIGSLYILQRAQMENYLTIYYHYIEPESNEEAKYRYLVNEISGLHHRQSFSATTEESKKKKQKEGQELDSLISMLEKNARFLSLSRREQKQFLRFPKAKEVGWEKLMRRSTLKNDVFLPSWKLFSNYAHSEMISLIQLKTYYKSQDERERLIPTATGLSMTVVSTLIINLIQLFPEIQKKYYDVSASLREQIGFWYKHGNDN